MHGARRGAGRRGSSTLTMLACVEGFTAQAPSAEPPVISGAVPPHLLQHESFFLYALHPKPSLRRRHSPSALQTSHPDPHPAFPSQVVVAAVCPPQVFVHPQVVLPSGFTYSQETIDKIMRDAAEKDTQPICPQSGLPIESVVPNNAIDSILSRYLFKQQITRDVVESLKQFQESNDAEDPLEAYMQRMKQNMVERLQTIHTDEMSRMAKG
eukprot:4714205-Pleurochrysis_carterae.AAC.1